MPVRTYVHGGSGRIVTVKTGQDASDGKREEKTEGYTTKPLSSSELKTYTRRGGRGSSSSQTTVNVQSSQTSDLPERKMVQEPEPSIEVTNKVPISEADKIKTQALMREQTRSSQETPDVQGQKYRFQTETSPDASEFRGSDYRREKDVSFSPYKPRSSLEKAKDYLSEGVGWFNVKAEKSAEKSKITSGFTAGGAWGSSFIYSAGSVPAQAVRHPWDFFVEGTAELVGSPIKTVSYIASNLGDPRVSGQLVGSIGTFHVAGKIGGQVISKIKYARDVAAEARYNAQFNIKNVDTSYKFNPEMTLLYDQAQLSPKPRAEIIGDVKSPPSSSLGEAAIPETFKSDVQTKLKAGEEYTNRFESYQGSELKPVDVPIESIKVTTESGQSFVSETPSQSQRLGTQRALQEKTAAELKIGETQKSLPEPSIKPDFMIEFKADGKNIKLQATEGKAFYYDNTPLFTSLLPGAEVAFFEASRLIDKIESPSKISTAPEVSTSKTSPLADPSTNAKMLRGLYYTPAAFYGDKPSRRVTKSDASIVIDNKSLSGVTPVSNFKPPKIDNFNPEDLRITDPGLKEGTTPDVTQEEKTTPRTSIKISGQGKQAEVEDIAQDQIQKPKQEIIVNEIIKPVKEEITSKSDWGGRPPPPVTKKLLFGGFVRPPVQQQRRQTGFNVFLRREGAFKKISSQALSKADALNLGTFRAGSTLAATFFLKEASTPVIGSFKQKGNIKDFYRKGNLFIEKRGKRLSTKSETQEIQKAGLFSKKLKFKKMF